jgi:nitrile hydratase subunit beta
MGTNEHEEPRFPVGERVRVLADNAKGNPRTPRYVRDKTGTVTAVHGVIDNPLDHRTPYPPLYTVLFDLEHLTGRPGADQVSVELHEDWLETASSAHAPGVGT